MNDLPDWYVAGTLRGIAHVLGQRPEISDGELLCLWRAYTAEGVAPVATTEPTAAR